MNFILTWTSRVNYFAAFDVFVAHYAFVTHRTALHFGFYLHFAFRWQSHITRPREPATRDEAKRKLIGVTRFHIRIRKGSNSSLARRLRCSPACDRLKTLHAAAERATGTVAQVSVLGSSNSPTPRHPNLHHRRAQHRQVPNARHPVQLVLIQGFADLP